MKHWCRWFRSLAKLATWEIWLCLRSSALIAPSNWTNTTQAALPLRSETMLICKTVALNCRSRTQYCSWRKKTSWMNLHSIRVNLRGFATRPTHRSLSTTKKPQHKSQRLRFNLTTSRSGQWSLKKPALLYANTTFSSSAIMPTTTRMKRVTMRSAYSSLRLQTITQRLSARWSWAEASHSISCYSQSIKVQLSSKLPHISKLSCYHQHQSYPKEK